MRNCISLVIAAFVLLGTGRAFACTPPVFPMPDRIAQIYALRNEGGALSAQQQEDADAYARDEKRYLEIYDLAYPCPLHPSDGGPKLTEAEQAAYRQEAGDLERKWMPPAISP